jgi:hypothetical protein
LEELKQAAVKKEERFSDRQKLAKYEDELQLVEVKKLEDGACEKAVLTETEDHVDVLLQVEQLEQQHQVSAIKNSFQVQLQQASETTMIADAVYNESQIGKDVWGSNDMEEINYELMPELTIEGLSDEIMDQNIYWSMS